MNSNRDPKIDRQDDPATDTGAIAPPELFTDGRVTELTEDVEIVLRRRAARAKSCPWLR